MQDVLSAFFTLCLRSFQGEGLQPTILNKTYFSPCILIITTHNFWPEYKIVCHDIFWKSSRFGRSLKGSEPSGTGDSFQPGTWQPPEFSEPTGTGESFRPDSRRYKAVIGRQERYVYFFLSPSNVVLPLNRQRIPKVSTRGGTENPILEHRLLDVDRYPAEEGEQRNTGSEKDSLEESRVELIESIKRSVLTDTSGNLHQPIMERGRLGGSLFCPKFIENVDLQGSQDFQGSSKSST
eukprot:Gb_00927 [translate_table: standard]